MGLDLQIMNWTPYTWTLGDHWNGRAGKRALDEWQFPLTATVQTYTSKQIYLEPTTFWADENEALAVYHVNDPQGSWFEFHYVDRNHPLGPFDPDHDAAFFVLSGTQGQYTSTGKVDDWMSRNLDIIKYKTLREMCIPNSHDTGTYNITEKTAVAPLGAIKTQTTDMYTQLVNGIRWFDIRPVLAPDGEWYSGHWSDSPIGWVGGNGAAIKDLMRDVNTFTQTHNELVILEINYHNVFVSTDSEFDHLMAASDREWLQMLDVLRHDPQTGLQHLWKPTENYKKSPWLTQIPIGDFIGYGPNDLKSAVVVIVNDTLSGVPIPGLKLDGSEGIYPRSVWPYVASDTDPSLDDERVDQWRIQSQNEPKYPYSFSLSHTPSKAEGAQILFEEASLGDKDGWTATSILKNANRNARRFFADLFPYTGTDRYPSAFNVDGIQGDQYAAIAMAYTQRSLKSWDKFPKTQQITEA